ncbi:MAG: lytic transglycosylase domain-containing protein [Chitinivibrionales bacterium]
MRRTLFSIPILIGMTALATRLDRHQSQSFDSRQDKQLKRHICDIRRPDRNDSWLPPGDFLTDSSLSIILTRGLRPLVKPQITSGHTRIATNFTPPDSFFPVPPQIRDNVKFWEKIFTEVSIAEGLLHDREYPLVIYKKMNFYGMSNEQRNEAIRAEIRAVKRSLHALKSQPDSTWGSRERDIAALFNRHGQKRALEDATERIRLQSGIRERFKWGLEQSTMYDDTIKAILRQYQVPERLAYLPHVESSFDIFARSKVGALGMWQFMPATARRFLTIDEIVDERLDPIRSTEAAAKLLAYNYKVLESWPLAVTAYNHGVTGMRNAVRSTGTTDLGKIIDRHTSPSFKFASKNFYSCFIAAARVASQPQNYFDDLMRLPPYKAFTLNLRHPIQPSTLTQYLNITAEQLAFYNPALNPRLFEPGAKIPRNYSLNIPLINRGKDNQEVTLAFSGGVLGMKAFYAATGQSPFSGPATQSDPRVFRVMDGRLQRLYPQSSFSAMVSHRFKVPHSPLPLEDADSTDRELVSLPHSAPHSTSFTAGSNL